MVNRNSSYYDIPKRLQYRVHHVLWDRSLSVMQSEQLEVSRRCDTWRWGGHTDAMASRWCWATS